MLRFLGFRPVRPCLVLACTALVGLGLGCTPKPSEKMLKAFEEKEQQKLVTMTIVKATPEGQGAYEEAEYADAYNGRLLRVMEALGNDLGFRVEVGQFVEGRYLKRTFRNYRVVAGPQKPLPGLKVEEKGLGWEIQPDFQDHVIVEKIAPADKGVEEWIQEGRKEDLQALKGEALAATKADAAKKIATFQKNVARVAKDLGAKRAWWVEYRHRPTTAMPTDSPFWGLADLLADLPNVRSEKPGSAPLSLMALAVVPHANFFKHRGQVDVKASLDSYISILFEGADGSLIKSEGYKPFFQ